MASHAPPPLPEKRMSMAWQLARRELGERWNTPYFTRFENVRLADLELAGSREVRPGVRTVGGSAALSLEKVEERYLLAAGRDGSISLYDMEDAVMEVSQPQPGQRQRQAPRLVHEPLATLPRSSPGAHMHAVLSVAWYPVDNGMFLTGSLDHQVKLWDTNTLQPVCSFNMQKRVYHAAMSQVTTSHCLVAVTSEDREVKLCDPATGALTHSLVGHRGPVWAAAWSRMCEFHLLTGGTDGQVRLWDIRRAGCQAIFNEQHTRRSTAAASASAPGGRWRRGDPGVRGAGAAGGRAPYARLGGGRTSDIGRQLYMRDAGAARAHAGAVTGLLPTPDGLHWLSTATDDQMRLWSSHDHRNLLVKYPDAFNRARGPRRMEVSHTSSLVYFPSGSVIMIYHLLTGRLLAILRGHIDTVNECAWNNRRAELYSAGADSILVWSCACRFPHMGDGLELRPPARQAIDSQPNPSRWREPASSVPAHGSDADRWSDSD